MTFLRRSCREAAALVIAREDQKLKFADRVALKLHMAVCQACPEFENQVLTMRSAMQHWRHYGSEAAGDAAQE